MTFLLYQLKVAAVLAAFWLFFRLLLSRETLHRLNRTVLLATVVLSFVLPAGLVTRHRTLVADPAADAPVAGATVKDPGALLFPGEKACTIQPGSGEETRPFPAGRTIAGLSVWEVLGRLAVILFFAGMAAVLLRGILSLLRIRRMIREGERIPLTAVLEGERHGGSPREPVVVVTDRAGAPKSWMRYIFLTREDFEGRHAEILLHEYAHVRLRHSWDLLLVDMASALQWFNPAIWLLRRDLTAVHEYEADRAVLEAGVAPREYQYLLVRKAMADSGYTLANGFSHSTLKGRIGMMLRRPSRGRQAWKLLVFMPLVAATLTLTARTKVDVVEAPAGKNAATVRHGGAAAIEGAMIAEEPSKSGQGEEMALRGITLSERGAMKAFLGESLSVEAEGVALLEGRVVDADGPVAGAIILERGSSHGAFTDENGGYSIRVSNARTEIAVSCIGHQECVLRAFEMPTTLVLKASAVVLDEAVVVAPPQREGAVNETDLPEMTRLPADAEGVESARVWLYNKREKGAPLKDAVYALLGQNGFVLPGTEGTAASGEGSAPVNAAGKDALRVRATQTVCIPDGAGGAGVPAAFPTPSPLSEAVLSRFSASEQDYVRAKAAKGDKVQYWLDGYPVSAGRVEAALGRGQAEPALVAGSEGMVEMAFLSKLEVRFMAGEIVMVDGKAFTAAPGVVRIEIYDRNGDPAFRTVSVEPAEIPERALFSCYSPGRRRLFARDDTSGKLRFGVRELRRQVIPRKDFLQAARTGHDRPVTVTRQPDGTPVYTLYPSGHATE